MASYQDIDTRLQVVEDKLDFIMRSFRMKVASPNGLLNADGSPSYSTFEGDLLEIYRMAKSKQLPVVNQSDGVAPPPLEDENGPVVQ